MDIGTYFYSDPFPGFTDSMTSVCTPAGEDTDCHSELSLCVQAINCTTCSYADACENLDFDVCEEWVDYCSAYGVLSSWDTTDE